MRNKNEKLQLSSHTEVSLAGDAVCRPACWTWFRGHGLVELADAGALCIETNRLLASRRTDHPQQDSVRRIPGIERARRVPPLSHGGTLETEDAGGTGKIPSSAS